MHTLDNLADTSFHTGLVAKVCDVLSRLSNNNTGFLRGDNRTEGQLSNGVIFLSLWGRLAIWSKALAINVEAIHRVNDILSARLVAGILLRHLELVM